MRFAIIAASIIIMNGIPNHTELSELDKQIISTVLIVCAIFDSIDLYLKARKKD